ncbi:hypothetical protein J6590_029923 [Homalodisca vitripennis]|nr:hypothetical protein J6590_029923 [Homalodisca vitripennis]
MSRRTSRHKDGLLFDLLTSKSSRPSQEELSHMTGSLLAGLYLPVEPTMGPAKTVVSRKSGSFPVSKVLALTGEASTELASPYFKGKILEISFLNSSSWISIGDSPYPQSTHPEYPATPEAAQRSL